MEIIEKWKSVRVRANIDINFLDNSLILLKSINLAKRSRLTDDATNENLIDFNVGFSINKRYRMKRSNRVRRRHSRNLVSFGGNKFKVQRNNPKVAAILEDSSNSNILRVRKLQKFPKFERFIQKCKKFQRFYRSREF